MLRMASDLYNETRATVDLDRNLQNQVRLEISLDHMLTQCQRLLNKHHGSPMPMLEAFHEELKHLKRMFYASRLTIDDGWQFRAMIDFDQASRASTIELVSSSSSSDDEPVPQPNWQRQISRL